MHACKHFFNHHIVKRQWHPTPVLLPGKSMDRGAWWAAVHGVAGSSERLSDFTFTFHFHALEKEMAPHSSVLAWRIPGTGKPDGLPSLGSHRVGHDWSDLAAAAAAVIWQLGYMWQVLARLYFSVNLNEIWVKLFWLWPHEASEGKEYWEKF